MLEPLKENIAKLISLYEAQKQRSEQLAEKLSESESSLEACRRQITELERQIDNLKLGSAFASGGGNPLAKERLTKLIAEIDKCIKLLQG
ncbi:MAG: hypothetical protein IJU69_01075 [Bacteroidales bacterium]|nr:hypothetical protein [Bacteroidales bacterium]